MTWALAAFRETSFISLASFAAARTQSSRSSSGANGRNFPYATASANSTSGDMNVPVALTGVPKKTIKSEAAARHVKTAEALKVINIIFTIPL